MSFLWTALAFVKKDLQEDASYRFGFALALGHTLLTLLFLLFVSRFLGASVGDRLDGHGGNWFSFAVVGVSLHSFLQAAIQRLASQIRAAQVLGTLEALLTTRTNLPTLVACLPAYPLLQTSLRVFGYLALGVWIFGMPLQVGDWTAALAVFALTLFAFGCLGLFTAGMTIAFKRAEPVGTLIAGLSFFLGGIYYPLSALPEWLRGPAHLLPITPALEALRRILLSEGRWADVLPELGMLLAFLAVMVPASLAFFRWAIRRAMRDGTLTQY
jgi:ABC-2 type transport system permease protein